MAGQQECDELGSEKTDETERGIYHVFVLDFSSRYMAWNFLFLQRYGKIPTDFFSIGG